MAERELEDLGEDRSLLLVDDDEPFLRRLARAMETTGASILNTGIGWHEARIPTIATSVPRRQGNRLKIIAG